MDSSMMKVLLAALIIVLVFRLLCQKSKYETYAPWKADSFTALDSKPMVPVDEYVSQPETTMPPLPPTAPMSMSVDLLPKENAGAQDSFAEFAPRSLAGVNSLLSADKFIGTDTQGSSLKNASYDIRSTPVIPKSVVGPWMQSSYEPELYRRPLE